MPITVYHNQRCSKSRATLERIRARGIEPTIVDYLRDPPDLPTLRDIVALLGVRAYDLVRRDEAPWATLGLTADSPDEAILAALVDHPVLLQRPLVVGAGRAVVGRPPENVDQLLDA